MSQVTNIDRGSRGSKVSSAPQRGRWHALAAVSFGLDVRSLALFRIGMGILILVDLALRSRDLEAHYTSFGVLPPDLLERLIGPMRYLSLHYLTSDSVPLQGVMFAIQAIVAIGFIVGYRTWMMTLLSWLLLVSLHRINDRVLNAGDLVMRAMLFWSLFLPLGARWSLDSVRRALPTPRTVVSIGSAAFVLQFCMMYWFTALLKTGPAWKDGTAIYYALNAEMLLHPLGAWLRQFLELMKGLTWASLALEVGGPLLAILPFGRGWLRVPVIAAFIVFHIVIGLCLEVIMFTYVCPIVWLALLPTVFWDWLLGRRAKQATVDPTSVHAAGPLFALPMTAKVFALLSLAIVLAINIVQLKGFEAARANAKPLALFGGLLGLDQRWSMFAPEPVRHTNWYVFDARLADGRHVNPFLDGQPITGERPQWIIDAYRNNRWLAYLIFLQTGDPRLPELADYVIRQWNEQHSSAEAIEQLTIIVQVEDTTATGRSPARRHILHAQDAPQRSKGS